MNAVHRGARRARAPRVGHRDQAAALAGARGRPRAEEVHRLDGPVGLEEAPDVIRRRAGGDLGEEELRGEERGREGEG